MTASWKDSEQVKLARRLFWQTALPAGREKDSEDALDALCDAVAASVVPSGEGEPAGRTPPSGEAFKALGRLYNHNADPDGVRAEYDRMTVFNALRGNAYDARYSFLMEYLNDVGTTQDILIRDTDRSDSTHIITRERKTHYMDDGERERVWEAIERDLMEHGSEQAKAEYKAISVPAPILRAALSSSPRAPLNALAEQVAAGNQKWWVGPDGTPLTRNAGELMMLVVSEVVEAFEGERKNLMDDKLLHRRMAEVEIADAIVRLLDYAAARGYDLDGAMEEKLAYNATREDHKKESATIATKNPLEFVSVRAASKEAPHA